MRIIDDPSTTDLAPADCAAARGTFDASKRTYVVKQVLDGPTADCPQLMGFFPVQFSAFDEDVTYCLAQQE